jgi:hypothetical protein
LPSSSVMPSGRHILRSFRRVARAVRRIALISC